MKLWGAVEMIRKIKFRKKSSVITDFLFLARQGQMMRLSKNTAAPDKLPNLRMDLFLMKPD